MCKSKGNHSQAPQWPSDGEVFSTLCLCEKICVRQSLESMDLNSESWLLGQQQWFDLLISINCFQIVEPNSVRLYNHFYDQHLDRFMLFLCLSFHLLLRDHVKNEGLNIEIGVRKYIPFSPVSSNIYWYCIAVLPSLERKFSLVMSYFSWMTASPRLRFFFSNFLSSETFTLTGR